MSTLTAMIVKGPSLLGIQHGMTLRWSPSNLLDRELNLALLEVEFKFLDYEEVGGCRQNLYCLLDSAKRLNSGATVYDLILKVVGVDTRIMDTEPFLLSIKRYNVAERKSDCAVVLPEGLGIKKHLAALPCHLVGVKSTIGSEFNELCRVAGVMPSGRYKVEDLEFGLLGSEPILGFSGRSNIHPHDVKLLTEDEIIAMASTGCGRKFVENKGLGLTRLGEGYTTSMEDDPRAHGC